MSGLPTVRTINCCIFPDGRIKDGKIVKVAGLKSPFDIVIDPQNRVWVSNSQSDTVVRFPADDPTKVETFRAGISVRALALQQSIQSPDPSRRSVPLMPSSQNTPLSGVCVRAHLVIALFD